MTPDEKIEGLGQHIVANTRWIIFLFLVIIILAIAISALTFKVYSVQKKIPKGEWECVEEKIINLTFYITKDCERCFTGKHTSIIRLISPTTEHNLDMQLEKFWNDSTIETIDYNYEPICTKYQFVKYGDEE